MKVKEIMSKKVQWVSPDASLEKVAKLMNEFDIGSVPVCQDSNVLGLITDRDIVIRTVAEGKNPITVKAKDVMSTNVLKVSPDTDAHDAADKMAEHQIRRLPVVENGKLVGMLALGDLAIESIHIDEAGEALNDISQGIYH